MLTTLDNYKESIDAQTTTNDSYFNNLLNRATSMIERTIVGRVLEEQQVVQYFNGSGDRILNLQDGPLVSVASVALVTYDSTGSIATTDAVNAGLYFGVGLRTRNWKLPGYLQTNGAWSWATGDQNYQVTYTIGYTTGSIPEELEMATIMAATFWWNKRKDAGTTSRDVGDGSIQFKTEKDLVSELHSMLEGYKSVRY